MPVMNKMRDSMPVVFAVLAGIFLLMIIFEWGGQGTLFSPQGDGQTLGVVNGRKITQKEYSRILTALTEQAKQQKKKSDLTDAEIAQVEDQAWDEAIKQAIVQESIEKMNVTVTDQDVRDYLFETPPEQLKAQFTDSLGQFHQAEYIKALRDPRNDSIVRNLETDMRQSLLQAKWREIVAAGINVSDAELKQRFTNTTAKANIQVVKLVPTPADEAAAGKALTDADIQKYYDSHKWRFNQDETRKFKFVVFQLTPSPRDSAMVLENANSIKNRLAQASEQDADSVAKEIVADYSDKPYQGPRPITAREWTDSRDFLSLKKGDVAIANISGQMSVIRVTDLTDTAKAMSHIRNLLVLPGTNKDSAMAAAQKLTDQARSSSFEQVARGNSMDAATALKGGDMGWIAGVEIPESVREKVLSAKDGEIVGPFETQNGILSYQMVARSHRGMRVIQIPLDVKPSSTSVNLQKQQAALFHDQAEKSGFDVAAKNASYRVITDAPPVQKKGEAIFGSKTFVNWIFGASKDEISQPIKIPAANATVVAQLTEIVPAGPRPFESIKNVIRGQVAKQKAVDMLEARAKQAYAAISSSGNLAAAAASGDSSLNPLTVSMGPAESVNGIPGGDYVVNNAAFTLKPGEISQPLKGEAGWYIVKVLSVQPATNEQFAAQRSSLIQTLLKEKQQRFFTQWLENAKDNATVVDHRRKS